MAEAKRERCAKDVDRLKFERMENKDYKPRIADRLLERKLRGKGAVLIEIFCIHTPKIDK